jgi:hypothetical protein
VAHARHRHRPWAPRRRAGAARCAPLGRRRLDAQAPRPRRARQLGRGPRALPRDPRPGAEAGLPEAARNIGRGLPHARGRERRPRGRHRAGDRGRRRARVVGAHTATSPAGRGRRSWPPASTVACTRGTGAGGA